MEMNPLILFGSGATARMMRYQFEHIGRKVAAHVVDDAFMDRTSLDGLPVIPLRDLPKAFPPGHFDCFVSIGPVRQNQLRTERLRLLRSMGYGIASYVSPHALVADNIRLSSHIKIGERSICQPFVTIGSNVFIGSGCIIGHGSDIADNCFIASGVITGGGVRIGENSFLGTGCIIRNDIRIGRNVTIGAGVTMLEDAADDQIYINSTAIRIPRNSGPGL
jgi:sugar O-acyltransferase (sialic acid O-acetyltransferase NeuD family)